VNREEIAKEISKFIKHSNKYEMPIFIDDLADYVISEIRKAKREVAEEISDVGFKNCYDKSSENCCLMCEKCLKIIQENEDKDEY